MATTTLRPNSTIFNTGIVAPSGTAHAVLADASDSTFVDLYDGGGENCSVGLDTFTLPAGALVKELRLRLRTVVGGSRFLLATVTAGTAQESRTFSVNWSTETTITVFVMSGLLSQADIDAATVSLQLQPSSISTANLSVLAVYLDMIYVPKPVVTVTGPTGTITDDSTPTCTWETS